MRQVAFLSLVACVLVIGFSRPASAQDPPPTPPPTEPQSAQDPSTKDSSTDEMAFLDRFTFLTGIRRTLSALQKRGITPTVDTIVPGSWIAFGVEVRRPRFGSL